MTRHCPRNANSSDSDIESPDLSRPRRSAVLWRALGLGTALVLAGATVACGEAPEPMPTDDPPPVTEEPVEVTEVEPPANNIVDVASEAGEFNPLLTALEAADLRPALEHDGPFTVFAPTDDAFGELPEGAVTDLLADEEQLTAVLLYHVVPGTLSAEEVADRSELETAGGEMLSVTVEDGNVFVNGAQVITADVEAENGVIHIIDGVLTP